MMQQERKFIVILLSLFTITAKGGMMEMVDKSVL